MKGIAFPAALSLCAAMPAMAQVDEPILGDKVPPEATTLDEHPADKGRVNISAGATVVSQYISRGVAFSENPSLQPFVTITVALPELTGGAVTDASLFAGNWNSIQHGSPGLGQPNSGDFSGWYEADLYAGGAVELADRWTVSATYYRYESPSNSFDAYNDLELIVGFDDSGFWDDALPLRNFSLSPALRMVQEVRRPNRPDALYIQPSLTPSFDLGEGSQAARLAFPLMVGLSDDYYDGASGGKRTYGFFRTGMIISGTPFPEAAPGFSADGGVDVWFLNNEVANGLGGTELVGRLGASWTF